VSKIKLRKFMVIFILVISFLTASITVSPLIMTYNENSTLISGVDSQGAVYHYEMISEGPINFYKKNSMEKAIGDSSFYTGYINISVSRKVYDFSIRIYGDANFNITLVKSFSTLSTQDSKLSSSFFTNAGMGIGEFTNVFNITAQNIGQGTNFGIIPNPHGSIHAISEELNLTQVSQQPEGFYESVSNETGGNRAYYVQSSSGFFLTQMQLTGNSSVVASLFENSSVSNVSLFSISLISTNVSIGQLNLSYYLSKYVVVDVIMWVVGIMFLISLYRSASRRRKN
jgi:hypothetical protein